MQGIESDDRRRRHPRLQGNAHPHGQGIYRQERQPLLTAGLKAGLV